jgi:ParB-like chromosome segregation protein Spo0J
MKIDKSKWERRRIKISALRPYPAQSGVYDGTTTRAEDEAFASDVVERGQLDEVHVMPNKNSAGLPKGTVVDGWRRCNAKRSRGDTEVDCYIRHDLAQASSAEVAAEFVRFNFHRRQLSGLARARCIQYLIEVQSGGSGVLGWKKREQLKKEIGEQLGIDKRSVNRYLLLLRSIYEVQQLYERKKIGLDHAGKVAQMPKADQLRIAERITAGETAKAVLEDYLRKRDDANDRVGGAFQYFINALGRHCRLLNGRVPEIDSNWLASGVGTLERARELIDGMIEQAKGSG